MTRDEVPQWCPELRANGTPCWVWSAHFIVERAAFRGLKGGRNAMRRAWLNSKRIFGKDSSALAIH